MNTVYCPVRNNSVPWCCSVYDNKGKGIDDRHAPKEIELENTLSPWWSCFAEILCALTFKALESPLGGEKVSFNSELDTEKPS